MKWTRSRGFAPFSRALSPSVSRIADPGGNHPALELIEPRGEREPGQAAPDQGRHLELIIFSTSAAAACESPRLAMSVAIFRASSGVAMPLFAFFWNACSTNTRPVKRTVYTERNVLPR